jgi:lipid A 3-O-deacylase
MNWKCHIVLLLPILSGLLGLAQSASQGPVVTLIEENDFVVNTDRHYTQGIKLAYLHRDGYLPFGSSNAFQRLPNFGFRGEYGKFGYVVGQNIYTPGDISLTELQPDDRPYAGWLYTGAVLQRRGAGFNGAATLESFELQFGVIGPPSLGEDAQTWVHEVRGFELPQGWQHQLHSEPGLRFSYLRAERLRTLYLDPLQFDFVPHAGFSLGNVETSVRLGGFVRLGFRLPDDYGTQTIDSLSTTAGGLPVSQASSWGIYVFAGSEGRAVLRNAFLDGNLVKRSHHVSKEFFVGEFRAGFAISWGHLELGYTHVFRTPEFKAQTEQHEFGSVFLKLRF